MSVFGTLGRGLAAAGTLGASEGLRALGRAGNADQDRAIKQYQEAVGQYGGIQPPTYGGQWNLLDQTRGYTPATVTPSAWSTINVNPQGRNAMLEGMSQYQNIYRQGGLTAADRAGYEQARQLAEQDAERQRAGVMARARERGIGGSRAELGSLLGANQGAAERAYGGGLTMAQNASNRRMAALGGYSELGSGLRSTDLTEQAARAAAIDKANQLQAEYNNAGQIYGANVNNARVASKIDAQNNMFGNQMSLASARANALGGLANQYQMQAQQSRDLWGGLAQGGLQAGTTLLKK